MNLLHDISELKNLEGPLHLAIGVFDGVHLGHKEVIEAAFDSAKEVGGQIVVVTFDPHPVEVLAPANAPRLLAGHEHKLLILEREMGVKNVLIVRFDRDFAEQTGEEFVRALIGSGPAGGIARICVGEAWQFGKGRSGDVELLRTLGSELNFEVTGVPTVEMGGMRVSSTRIREAVGAGDFEVAEKLLGRKYTVYGTVIGGRKLGRTIGFPTANLTVHSEQLPPTGVYAVRVVGYGDSWDGVANLGYRPTVEGGEVKRLLEIHLFGLDYEIYGEDLEVEFVQFLRREKKFSGVDELKEQIALDVEKGKKALT
ncbi:MAG: bifunctional riboflavin kinase/FMN adenylyltransferase [Verrucomicrobiales bacterium]|nr:bifunctional riboflavin kinase/FMN adenylyltransferase [Verrucomicrobiales bacterium]